MALVEFLPQSCVIHTITQANPAIVTTVTDHNFITGLIVRIDIPEPGYYFNTGANEVVIFNFGMNQINQQFAPIVVIDDVTFSIALDTTLYDPFVYNIFWPQSAQAIPIGEANNLLRGATQNVLPGQTLP